MRPLLEFKPQASGRIAAMIGVIDVAVIMPGLLTSYLVRLPLPDSADRRWRRAASVIEAKQAIYVLASEWFAAIGVLDLDQRVRCDERLYPERGRRR